MLGLHTVETTVVPILVALIAAGPAFLAYHSGRRFRKENNDQHQQTSESFQAVLETLGRLDGKVDRVETKIDRHLGEHDAQQAFSARTARAKAARR